jgi:hypothetical protein
MTTTGSPYIAHTISRVDRCKLVLDPLDRVALVQSRNANQAKLYADLVAVPRTSE